MCQDKGGLKSPLNVLRLSGADIRVGLPARVDRRGHPACMATRHGFYDIDSEHEPTKSLCIGPDRAGNLLELLYLQAAEQDVVIHAMPLRPVLRTCLTGE